MPLFGSIAVVMPILTDACSAMLMIMPKASNIPKRSRACIEIKMPHIVSTRKINTTNNVNCSPSSSPMIGKMNSVCAYGKYCIFSRLSPKPRP